MVSGARFQLILLAFSLCGLATEPVCLAGRNRAPASPPLLHWYDNFELGGKLFHWTALENGMEVFYYDFDGDGVPDRRDIPFAGGYIAYLRAPGASDYGERIRYYRASGYERRYFERAQSPGVWRLEKSVLMEARPGNLARVQTITVAADGRTEENIRIIPVEQGSWADDLKHGCEYRFRKNPVAASELKDWGAITKEVNETFASSMNLHDCGDAAQDHFSQAVLGGMECMNKLGGHGPEHAGAMLASFREVSKSGKKIGLACWNGGDVNGNASLPCAKNWPEGDQRKDGFHGALNFTFGASEPYTPRRWHKATVFHEFMHFSGYPHADDHDTMDLVYACQTCCYPVESLTKGRADDAVPNPQALADAKKAGCAICKNFTGFETISKKYLKDFLSVMTAQYGGALLKDADWKDYQPPFAMKEVRNPVFQHLEVWDWDIAKEAWKYTKSLREWGYKYPDSLPCTVIGRILDLYPNSKMKTSDPDFTDMQVLFDENVRCVDHQREPGYRSFK